MLKRVWRIGLLVLLLGPLAGTFSAIAQCGETPCPPPPSEKPPPGFISILVIVNVAGAPECDIAKKPIEGAKVTLISKAERVYRDKVLAEGFTNKEGKFAVWIIIFGRSPQEAVTNLEVDVKKEGFEPKPKSVVSMVVTIPFFGTFILTNVCLQRKLDLQIFKLDGTKLGNDEEGGPPDEETIGSQNCVNNDNDDRDNKFDKDDSSVKDGSYVVNEDDLVKLIIRKPQCVTGENRVRLSIITKGSGRVKVWEQRSKEVEVALPKEYKVSELEKVLWVEGLQGSTTQRDVEFLLEAVDFEARPDKVTMTVIAVQQTQFIGQGNSVRSDNNLDHNSHPTAPVGVRVFSEAHTPGGAARDKVKVKVTLSVPVVHDLIIYARPMDVDDPSSDGDPVDPNDALANTGAGDNAVKGNYQNTTIPYTQHEDNRGNVGGFKAGKLLPGPDVGIVEEGPFFGERYTLAKLKFKKDEQEKDVLRFQVTKQPGDNFRLGFTCDALFLRDAINQDNRRHEVGIRNFPADKELEWQSPVLTVWRRLHVERDSMGPVVRNSVSGNITNLQPRLPPVPPATYTESITQAFVDNNLDDGSPNLSLTAGTGNGRFENGTLTVAGTTEIRLITGNGRNFIQRNAGLNLAAKPLPFFALDNDTWSPKEWVNGTVTLIFPLGLVGWVLILDVTTSKETPIDWEDFKGGTISVSGGPPMEISDVIITPGLVAVEVRNLRIPYSLVDDDDNSVLPAFPDTNWMQDSDNAANNLFAQAYVRPTYDGAGNPANDERNVPFDLNTEDAGEAENAGYYTRRQSAGANSNDYWALYMLSVFQGPVRGGDADPNSEDGLLGFCSLPGPDLCGDVAIVYLEGYRDGCGGLNAGPGRSGLQATVVHEVGHIFGGRHEDGQIMVQGCVKAQRFSDRTLNRIRSVQRPGGGPF